MADVHVELLEPFMFPFLLPRTPKSAEDLQRESIARDAKELKEYLDRLTPEERAKFWQDIEGKGAPENKQTP